MVVLLVLLMIILFLTIDYFVQRAERRRTVVSTPGAVLRPTRRGRRRRGQTAEEHDPTELPRGVFVAPGHVWMQVEPSGSVLVGVDRLLLSLLGGVDCLYALPEGSSIREGGGLMMLRHGHRALKIRSPIAGAVSAVNHPARRTPGRIASDPFGAGWIYRISPTGLADSLRRARVAEQAAHWMRQELARLRDLLGAASSRGLTGATATALADGGLLSGVELASMDDPSWERLVAGFFDDAAPDFPDGSPEPVGTETNR